MSKRANKQATQITVPTETFSQPEAELADNSHELSPEELAAAEASLEDDDDFSGEGAETMESVIPENEDDPAYESEVDSEDDQSDPEDDQSEAELDAIAAKIKADQEAAKIKPVDPKTETITGTPNPIPAEPSEPINQPDPEPTSTDAIPSLPLKPSRRTTVPKTYKPPTPPPSNLAHTVAVLQDGDIMEGDDQNRAFPFSHQLSSADECLAWMNVNNLTAAQQETNQTWLVKDSSGNIIGAGASLPIACHASGMRSRVEIDLDVENP